MKYLIVANWKMNPVSLKSAERILDSVVKKNNKLTKTDVVICPPFLYIPFLKKDFKIGAQNCFSEKEGSFTGEISPFQLRDMNCDYVILGHSERRKYFKETDELINDKIKESLKSKLIPIVCVGEGKEERKRGKAFSFVESQVSKCLAGLSKKEAKKIVFAYEPVWAIGSGNPASFKDAEEMRICIQKVFLKTFDISPKIIYGGSVDVDNASGYLEEAGFKGLLIGGASLDKRFSEILRILN